MADSHGVRRCATILFIITTSGRQTEAWLILMPSHLISSHRLVFRRCRLSGGLEETRRPQGVLLPHSSHGLLEGVLHAVGLLVRLSRLLRRLHLDLFHRLDRVASVIVHLQGDNTGGGGGLERVEDETERIRFLYSFTILNSRVVA